MKTEGNKYIYNVLEFTEYPGPRYKHQGDDSGEEFYWSILKPLFEKIMQQSEESNQRYVLEVNLDNTAGYASSFLDEAFGNLAFDFTEKVVKDHIKIVSSQEPDWIEIIMSQTIPQWHKKKLNGIPRKPDTISNDDK